MRLEEHVKQSQNYGHLVGAHSIALRIAHDAQRKSASGYSAAIEKMLAAIEALPAGARKSQLQNELFAAMQCQTA